MKNIFLAALLIAAPAFVLAQAPAKPAAKTPAKTAAKSSRKKAPASPSRIEARSTANQLASGIRAAEAALSPDEVKLAERVITGRLPCELGAFVSIEADPKSPGYFNLEIVKGPKFRMLPVLSRTGAIRLEDQFSGAVWLQLSNKSMLMDQKGGKRLADECMSPDQATVAEALRKNPPPSLLDPLPAGKTSNAAASAAAATSQPTVVVQPVGLPSAPDAAAVVPLTQAAAPAPLKAASAP